VLLQDAVEEVKRTGNCCEDVPIILFPDNNALFWKTAATARTLFIR
jgi:hypothetical protein